MQVPTNVFPDKPALPSRELLLLSLREWEALLYIADDLSNEEIAPNLWHVLGDRDAKGCEIGGVAYPRSQQQ